MQFNTKAIHAGIEPDPVTGAIMTPIYQTSTYVQDGPGRHKGYEYARTQNPTRTALQHQLAALENGLAGFCFGSGMAAIDTLLKLFNPGDEIISTHDLYGGTYRLFTKVFERYGLKFHFVDMTNTEEVISRINEKTKMFWVETPTNPMLQVIDIEAMCSLAKKHGIMTVVDNTFASPYLQTPMDLGADIVMHSATKYLGGHSDVVHGALIVKQQEIADQIAFLQNACGAVPGPQDCFLILRGIKTLHVRVQRACENAAQIAEYLKTKSSIEQVFYPGLSSHPGYAVARKQMRMPGAMVSFSMKGDNLEKAKAVLSSTRIFACAESLGGVESLIGHPASMTHASIPKEERQKSGVVDSLIRLSVGIEDIQDLIADLEQALSKNA